jgi:hypothetical protein
MLKENFGYIPSKITARDWIFGGFTPIPETDTINNWETYLPIVEYQNSNGFDEMACVTYSILNCLEILYLYKTNKEINFSDRYIAKMSGTTNHGNSLEKVFNTIRTYGLVEQNVYPNTAKNWDEYYQEVPQEIIDKGKEFLNTWNVYREWVNPDDKDAIYTALYGSPLQVVVRYAQGLENEILSPVGAYNHAVMCYGAKQGKYWEIFDHYTQIRKRYAWDYKFDSVLKPTLILKNNIMFIPKDNALFLLVEGKEQKLAMGLNGKLVIFTDKIDTLLNSASRSGKFNVPIPLTLTEWESVSKVDGKGNPIN